MMRWKFQTIPGCSKVPQINVHNYFLHIVNPIGPKATQRVAQENVTDGRSFNALITDALSNKRFLIGILKHRTNL